MALPVARAAAASRAPVLATHRVAAAVFAERDHGGVAAADSSPLSATATATLAATRDATLLAEAGEEWVSPGLPPAAPARPRTLVASLCSLLCRLLAPRLDAVAARCATLGDVDRGAALQVMVNVLLDALEGSSGAWAS